MKWLDSFKTTFIICLINIIVLTIGIFVLSKEARGNQETRKRLVIIDTGLKITEAEQPYICTDIPFIDYTGYGIDDNDGHGTNIFNIIKPSIIASRLCVTLIKFFDGRSPPIVTNRGYANAMKKLEVLFPDYVNLSIDGTAPTDEEYSALKHLVDAGTKITIAAGNQNRDLSDNCNVYPACVFGPSQRYPNLFVVGSIRGDGWYSSFTNKNGPVTDYEQGERVAAGGTKPYSGTSQAAAIKMSKVIYEDFTF